ncbi:MAG: alpha/beta fold hydrolase [Chloroflexi bacterium]|nr:alpha/beta fold hydrolase [Chloroflexota bacterium]
MNRSKWSKLKPGRSFLSAVATAILVMFMISGSIFAQENTEMNPEAKPTIVLVHGAFADASSWDGVIPLLLADGYSVVAPPNPLRGVKSDAASVASVLDSIQGPIVLVGHSYGGMVITNAATGHDNVQALVYVDGFAPDAGETSNALNASYPGSELLSAITPVVLPDGSGADIFIQQDKVPVVFAADVPEAEAQRIAVTQRPIFAAAGDEASGEPAWKTIPSWFIYGDRDLVIPPALLGFMAKRAGSQETVVIPGASHVAMISHPDQVTDMIVQAAREVEDNFEAAG